MDKTFVFACWPKTGEGNGMDTLLKEAAELVAEADALLLTAGAGMGADSGLPDFRGKEGFWRAYPVIAKLGYSFAEMVNPGWFGRDPHLAWAFYGHRLNLYRRTVPHSGFRQLLAGTAVPTVRLTSEHVVSRFNGALLRINPREPDVPRGQVGIPLGAAEGIRRILERMKAAE